ncbi:MAG: hypothetical protein IJS62_00110 [Bacteroidales bacterium]|nr:hypothetical protein [Bacteroidales bacterium]
MKKFLTAIAFISTFCACEKVKEVEPGDNTQSGGKQIITATVNVASKLTYSENTPGGGSGISSVWAAGDKFYAIQDGSTVVTFNIVDGVGNTTATFQAETEGVTELTEWKAVLGGHASVHGTEIHCGFTDQGGVLSSLNNYNYVVADGTGLTPNFDFENGEKLTYLMRIKLPAGVKCIEYTCPALFKVTGTGAESTRAIGDNEAYANMPTRTITLASASSAGDPLYLAVPAVNHSHTFLTYENSAGKHQYKNRQTGVIVTFLNDTSDDATLSNGTVLGAEGAGNDAPKSDLTNKGGQIGTFDLSDMTLIKRPKPSDAVEVTSTNQSKTWYSGAMKDKASKLTTYWAPFNVGADNNYELGEFYAYGEVSTKDNFTFSTHRNRHKAQEDNYYDVIAKEVTGTDITYCTIAGSRYDVARVKWGSAWRMAEALEWHALGQQTHSVTTLGGQQGVLYNSAIFLPYIGGVKIGTAIVNNKNDESSNSNNSGYTPLSWSASTIAVSQANSAYKWGYSIDVQASSGNEDWWNIARCVGLPVRAVLSSSTRE